VRFVNLNVAEFDAYKHAGLPLIADARVGLEQLAAVLAGYRVDASYTSWVAEAKARWEEETDRIFNLRHGPPLSQGEVIGAVSKVARQEDVVLNAAGSLPGDLHKLWRTRKPGGYHMEYGYSCMGYEIPGGIGAKMADPSREVYVMVGDASFLMMSSEIATAVQEGLKLTIVVFDNHGFSSIGGLSMSIGSGGFGTNYRCRTGSGQLDGEHVPVDFAALCAGLGAETVRVRSYEELEQALIAARQLRKTCAVVVEVDKEKRVPGYESWWDVQVAEVSEIEAVQQARADYEIAVKRERRHELDAKA
jgi:3D-(3,5/4)-trihydroxycyclohexane-1,2-dione acylhydrolase (decyclizing)